MSGTEQCAQSWVSLELDWEAVSLFAKEQETSAEVKRFCVADHYLLWPEKELKQG
jgi:hypothetical protein